MGGPGSGRRKLSDDARVEVRRRVANGERVDVVAFELGVSVRTIFRVIAKAGGVPPRSTTTSDRYLMVAERIQIEVGLRCGDKANVIAARLGRSPSTISREVSANGGRDNYQAFAAERRAHELRARPKAEKLALNPRLRAAVEYMLEQHLSLSS